jgi:hypothetical protein
MKLTDADTPTVTLSRSAIAVPGVVPELGADSIRVARLGAQAVAKPAPLAFVAAEPRRAPIDARAVLLLVVAVIAAGLIWVLISSGTSGSSGRAHSAAAQVRRAEGPAATAARAWAAAIEKAWRDRGTDAELQDTIPPPAPPRS